MTTQFELIRQQQKESWNKISSGWKKWDEMTMDFLKPMGDEIIRVLQPSGQDIVLDIAAGTGEPGLTITMLSGGKVYVTDIAENMVEIARENAMRRGIKNVETITCEVSELPFADNTFDAISCRFGFMFFPDIQKALRFSDYLFSYSLRDDFDNNHHFGRIIFSKLPIINKQTVVNYPNDYNATFQYVDVLTGNDTIRVFNVHLQSLKFSKANLSYLDKANLSSDSNITESKSIISKIKN